MNIFDAERARTAVAWAFGLTAAFAVIYCGAMLADAVAGVLAWPLPEDSGGGFSGHQAALASGVAIGLMVGYPIKSGVPPRGLVFGLVGCSIIICLASAVHVVIWAIPWDIVAFAVGIPAWLLMTVLAMGFGRLWLVGYGPSTYEPTDGQ